MKIGQKKLRGDFLPLSESLEVRANRSRYDILNSAILPTPSSYVVAIPHSPGGIVGYGRRDFHRLECRTS